ncbi:acyl-[acyl-carrier-protein]--UDP-N-acetylglucosamine O-acyltransferase [Sulfuriferula sp. AH1]|uniref:acyl-ACP--UDP-N-acetylglucosamine O-acyltransferase n=1 Tax=Sulfuriferula sp. AH1 TaxID=1985873 RepID=UPI000B3B4A59|nr:acyl-ACP--UDP-N-acetylglucosamine O-acyltransferase [Sulfuriferula sp. AH1]ARU31034.1 acyl-[acyl-carrier-protein]--UDP-N-acetylglucosamine O-acyltransferase [Sulfuriferula sp. AH1]
MIHETAIIHLGAQLGTNVSIGPYSIIGEHVQIGDGTTVAAHAVIHGHTTIGRDNRIFQFCSLGEIPQDKKYAGEPTRLEIGDRNIIREFCTFNVGTIQDVGVTRVGNDNWIMAYVHLAHDCQVGNNTIFANNASLAGHVHVGDYAILGGFTGVHQFCKIGAHVMTGISSVVFKDIPPYVMAAGQPAAPHGLNSEGLKRRGFSAAALAGLKRAYKILYREGLSFSEAQTRLAELVAEVPEVALISDFLAQSERGIIR